MRLETIYAYKNESAKVIALISFGIIFIIPMYVRRVMLVFVCLAAKSSGESN